MASRVVMASRRFPKEYTEFLKKYDDLKDSLRDFLTFRQTHLPNESFGSKDARLTSPASANSKLRRYHVVHGRAILIYQLYGSEIRLIAMLEHDEFDSASKGVINYHRSLQPDDYYTFNPDEPVPAKAANPIPTQIEQVQEPELVQEELVQEAEIAPEPDPIVQPVPPHANGTSNPLLDDRVVQYLKDRNMLAVPRPAKPMIPIFLTKEIIAEKGDVLLIEPTTPTIYHLTPSEYEAHFEPYSYHTTHLGDAIAAIVAPPSEPRTIAMRRPAPAPVPAAAPPAAVKTPKVNTPVYTRPATSLEPIKRPARRNNIGAQTGRLIAVIAHLQQTTRTNKIDTASMREMLGERDAKAVSTTLFNAQGQGLVNKVGPKPDSGRAYYYCLTKQGEKQVRSLGNWPFEAAGQIPPFVRQNGGIAA